MEAGDEQQFCLRWNNFQANITSQFETLRDDEDFTDVTIACEGQRLQAHKVVLSACSPYFKELFKTNPCSHPIIFMRDVEARHVIALMEFMYAGEVNVAQAHLSAFLKTAESLKIRGLTDTNMDYNQKDDDAILLNTESKSSPIPPPKHRKLQSVPCSSTVTSSQDESGDSKQEGGSPPPSKKQCKPEQESEGRLDETELQRLKQIEEVISVNPFAVCESQDLDLEVSKSLQPKVELPEYLSDDEDGRSYFRSNNDISASGGMEIIPQNSIGKDSATEHSLGPVRIRRRRTSENWLPFEPSGAASPDLLSRLRECRERREKDGDRRNRLVKLGEGIEICEDQLRSVKWSDYRKLTRGLATILFSPAELATCSVTGQRWSRAGSGERPVKPALDRAKVQAIISYVATRFPMVEISRIKQVLAYKCKENSTAFKMKAVRYYGDQIREPDKN